MNNLNFTDAKTLENGLEMLDVLISGKLLYQLKASINNMQQRKKLLENQSEQEDAQSTQQAQKEKMLASKLMQTLQTNNYMASMDEKYPMGQSLKISKIQQQLKRSINAANDDGKLEEVKEISKQRDSIKIKQDPEKMLVSKQTQQFMRTGGDQYGQIRDFADKKQVQNIQ